MNIITNWVVCHEDDGQLTVIAGFAERDDALLFFETITLKRPNKVYYVIDEEELPS